MEVGPTACTAGLSVSGEPQRAFGNFCLGDLCDSRLSVKQTRTLQLDEDVLCVRFSPDQKLLAVSLLDCTVKVFYVDSLKVQWPCL